MHVPGPLVRKLTRQWPSSCLRVSRLIPWFSKLLLVFLATAEGIPSACAQETILPAGSSWRWRKGTNEVSNPNNLWRGTGFSDSAWPLGNTPFHYNEDLSGGTVLTDMRSNYTCIFLRSRFVVANVSEIASVVFVANYDDGFVAWINGTEVARRGFTNASPAYTHTASISHEAGTAETITVANPPVNYLVAGTNILAVQAFNQSLTTSADFRFETLLQITKTNFNPPVLTSVLPAPDSALGALTQITVFFSEPVYGVDAGDLLVNGQPASAVLGVGGTNRYTFTFTQPLPGFLGVTWNDSPAITDLQGAPFDHGAANTTWSYTLVDNLAPQLGELTPVPGAQVSQLTQVEVSFNEPVFGVDTADLRINGQPAASLSGAEAGPYVFQFPSPSAGTVNLSWAGGHGIADLAVNAFAGSNWSVTLHPGLAPGDIVINEFVAGNLSGLLDEDGERQDWIEIHNRGANAVNLLGWSLTDNPNVPGLWTFPSRILDPGQYLVVFASGKDRRAPAGANRFHTNFRLEFFGEYLALFNAESPRVAASEFTPRYPEQRNDYSYGLQSSIVWRYFQMPTPGTVNGSSSIVGIAPEPHFSVGRGLFEAPFNLLLTTTLPGATIRFTRDGSEPTAVNGLVYSAPLQITNTSFVRAAVFAPDYLPSRTRTHSYIYLDDVLTQPNDPPGFPASWGTFANFPNNIVPADYETDLDPLRTDPNNPASDIDPAKRQRLRDGLRELPVVSLVMNMDDLFNPPGLYHTPNVTDKNFPDQPCSVEMLEPDGTTAFALSGGLRAHGNASREPSKNPKHGFKLDFRGEFGEARLEYPLFPDSPAREFDDLILRPDFNASWRHWSDTVYSLGSFQRSRATRMHDAWLKHSQREMGHVASHNRFFHLFLNGLYWGTYDFTEQPTKQFGANYFGGTDEDYDVYDQGRLSAGTSTAYQTLLGITGLADHAKYELIKQYLDVTEFMDYMLLHHFAGHQDWGNNKNWYALRRRAAGAAGTFKYFPWDGESVLLDENVNRVASTDVPSGLFAKLDDNAQFRLDFADRVHKHLIAPGGALTRAANTARWEFWQAVLDKPIVAETVRWGDYRRDVHPFQNGLFQLYTREDHWLPENERKLNSYFVNRGDTVLNQFRSAGLYPAVEAPEYRQATVGGPIMGGGMLGAGTVVAMRNPGAGTIYYTTNGSDPRVYYSGALAAGALAYSTPLTLSASVTLKSRVWNEPNWSALNEASFTVGELGLPLRITEIMHHPIGGDACTFIEIQNVGASPLDIGGFRFQGIDFIVPVGTIISPGAVLLLANNANPVQFAARYPSAVVFGYFGGNLAIGGERLAILDRNGRTVIAVHYDDEDGWPVSPAGGGYSLEIIDPRGDPNAPDNWRASSAVNGTPGLPPVPPVPGDVVLNEIMADNAGSVTNGGAFPDWVELRNRSGGPVNLANWSLTDDSNARKFVFPANTTIPAGEYLLVWCDSATSSPGLHTGFALGRNGQTVSLFDANTNRLDALTYGLQLADYTVGRVAGQWRLTLPTPNAANTAVALAATSQVALNEWLASPEVSGQDWLELFNRSFTAPVALRGLYLGTSNALSRYHALSFMAPRGHAQLFAEERSGANQLEFKLPAAGGDIVLYDETGVELERITYGLQTAAVSEGRLPDGGATITAFSGSVTPGASNYVLAYNGPVLNEVLARNQRAVVSPWGSYADFVELYNGSGSSVNLGGMALGRSLSPGDRWTIPAGVTISAGEHLLIWCDGLRAASTTHSSGSGLNTGFNLPGESGELFLFNPVGQPVDSVGYGFQVEDLSLGRSVGEWRLLASPTPGTANAAPAALGPVTALRINEWMAAPLAGDDWFELHNTGTLPVDLGGLFVTDDPSTRGTTKSPIPPLSFIGAGRWVTFIADDHRAGGRHHVAFALDAAGETLRLYDSSLNLIDAVDFGVQTLGTSVGRVPDGGSSFAAFPASASPGAANFLLLTNVVVNEVLTHTDAENFLEDAVELHNPTASAVNLGGWYLSDSSTDLKRYRIPDGTAIPAGGFKVFYQYQFGTGDGEADVPPLFSFNSAHGDALWLAQADAAGNLSGSRTGVEFDAAANGVSVGRYQTSVGVEFVEMSRHTFGVSDPTSLSQFRTGTGATNAYPRVGPIVINEIMYHPPDWGTNAPAFEEFIELLNLTNAPTPLFDPAHATNAWRLANAVTFDFPPGTTIPANGLLLVAPFDPVAEPTALALFQARYGTNAAVVGPYSGSLDNAGETLELWRPDTPQSESNPEAGFVPYLLVERVVYGDAPPWPAAADGQGPSLQRVAATHYGNDPVNWMALSPTAGRANVGVPTGSVTFVGAGTVRLAFAVHSGVSYQVQYKTNLADADWLPLGASLEANGSVLTVDDVITGQLQRFYRLVVLP